MVGGGSPGVGEGTIDGGRGDVEFNWMRCWGRQVMVARRQSGGNDHSTVSMGMNLEVEGRLRVVVFWVKTW
jgi:hypothetical protein